MNEITVQYAGFWKRLLAYILDSIILLIPLMLLMKVMGIELMPEIPIDATDEEIMAMSTGMGGGVNLIFMAVFLAYFVLMESSSKQGTVGKIIFGLKVTDIDGDRLTIGKAFIRYLGKIVSSLILGIGFLMIAFTAKKQGLHDLIASTLVLKK